MSTFVSVSQLPSGAVAATLYLDSLYLLGIPSKANTISLEFDYSAGVLCKTTLPVGSRPAPSVSVKDTIQAQFSFCPANDPTCGMNADSATSNEVSLIAAGSSGKPGSPGVGPGGAVVPNLPSATKAVPAATSAAAAAAASAFVAPVPPMVITSMDSSPNPASNSNTGASPGSSGGPSMAVIGGGVAALLAVLAVGFFVYRRHSSKAKRLAAQQRLSTVFGNGPVAFSSTKDTLPVVPVLADPQVLSSPAGLRNGSQLASTNSAASYSTVPAELGVASLQQQQFEQPQYIQPQQYMVPPPQQQFVQQPVAQFAPPQNHVYPPQNQQPVVYPGFYDQQGNYHYYSAEQLLQQQQQLQLQQGAGQ
ncbi:hypothetical protein HDU98_004286 [Podochytrium sp. JEL0797]|nr:hypothetical protein HDU98_004286 [Podochytrium sp. JEL0797]